MARRGSLILGRWRIVETELWDRGALDLAAPAYIRFDRQRLGEMELVAIGASIDYRVVQHEYSILDSAVQEFTAWHGTPWE